MCNAFVYSLMGVGLFTIMGFAGALLYIGLQMVSKGKKE